MTDEQIIKAYEGLTPRQQLALFRNLYYNDGYATERGIVANAINDIHARQRADVIKEFAEVFARELSGIPKHHFTLEFVLFVLESSVKEKTIVMYPLREEDEP